MTRKTFLQLFALSLTGASMSFANVSTPKAPALFVGHGSPMNAIESNRFSQALNALGKSLTPPTGVLVISAHWQEQKPTISLHESPEVMYDFGGFPKELYEVKYPAPNAPKIETALEELGFELESEDRPLDHGAWSVLVHLFPKSNIPIMQLAISYEQSFQEHFELGKKLAKLREAGIMILGSGNVTHNLRAPRVEGASVLPWAASFDTFVKNSIEREDYKALIKFNHPDRVMAHPSSEHYIPLLYTVGAKMAGDEVKFFNEYFDFGHLSMRSVLFSK